MPVKAPVSACAATASLISSTLVSRPATIVRSTTEPVGAGARPAKPCILPWSSGMTRPIALAAPVEAGTRLIAAARARRRALWRAARPRRCGAGVLVRRVLQAVIGGVGVDRPHQALLDADQVVEDLGDRREAVRRARRVGDDVVVVGLVDVVEVDAEDDSRVRLGRGRRDDDLLGAGLEVLGRVRTLG